MYSEGCSPRPRYLFNDLQKTLNEFASYKDPGRFRVVIPITLKCHEEEEEQMSLAERNDIGSYFRKLHRSYLAAPARRTISSI